MLAFGSASGAADCIDEYENIKKDNMRYQRNILKEYDKKSPPQTATLYWAMRKCLRPTRSSTAPMDFATFPDSLGLTSCKRLTLVLVLLPTIRPKWAEPLQNVSQATFSFKIFSKYS